MHVFAHLFPVWFIHKIYTWVCVSSTCVDWCVCVSVCAPTATQESSQPKKHANATWIHFECGFQVDPLELVKKATHTHIHTNTHIHMRTVRNMKCIEMYGIDDDDNPSGFAFSYCLYKLHFIHSKNVRPSPSAALSLFIFPSLPISLFLSAWPSLSLSPNDDNNNSNSILSPPVTVTQLGICRRWIVCGN